MLITINGNGNGNNIDLAFPYGADDVRTAIKTRLAGRWDPARKVWTVPAAARPQVEATFNDEFGGFNTAGAGTVVIRATRDVTRTCRGLYGLGRVLLDASGRDSGVRAGAGVIIEDGRPRTGGSARYWTLNIPEGTVLRVTGVNLDAVRDEDGTIRLPDGFEVVEVDEATTPATPAPAAPAVDTDLVEKIVAAVVAEAGNDPATVEAVIARLTAELPALRRQ